MQGPHRTLALLPCTSCPATVGSTPMTRGCCASEPGEALGLHSQESWEGVVLRGALGEGLIDMRGAQVAPPHPARPLLPLDCRYL